MRAESAQPGDYAISSLSVHPEFMSLKCEWSTGGSPGLETSSRSWLSLGSPNLVSKGFLRHLLWEAMWEMPSGWTNWTIKRDSGTPGGRNIGTWGGAILEHPGGVEALHLGKGWWVFVSGGGKKALKQEDNHRHQGSWENIKEAGGQIWRKICHMSYKRKLLFLCPIPLIRISRCSIYQAEDDNLCLPQQCLSGFIALFHIHYQLCVLSKEGPQLQGHPGPQNLELAQLRMPPCYLGATAKEAQPATSWGQGTL